MLLLKYQSKMGSHILVSTATHSNTIFYRPDKDFTGYSFQLSVMISTVHLCRLHRIHLARALTEKMSFALIALQTRSC